MAIASMYKTFCKLWTSGETNKQTSRHADHNTLPKYRGKIKDNACMVETSFLHHRLRGSASPVLTATGFVNGKWQSSTHTESTPLDQPITKKFVTGD